MDRRTATFLVLLAICGAALADTDTACLEPKNTGPCQAYFPRYYFNNATKTCEEFIYGGCRGNGNNFATLQECQSRCDSSKDSACLELRYPGSCKGYFPRYYFNKNTNTCLQFIYGGCQGNGNNFETLQECQSRCG
ncbi:hypothetical protein V5799_002722, partial [Amblyomma americanum]